jgi:NADH dehydrogenase
MILITGGTGFIGRALIRHLVEHDQRVRILIRPSPRSPDLPQGVPLEVAVSSILDERSLRAAMLGVNIVYHLASAEWRGARGNLMEIDIQGTQTVIRAAVDAGVRRFFYVSHLGADRASAFPLLKAKAIAEEYIRRSGLDYTILRSALVFGPNDHFTTGLARLLHALPFYFLIPGDGSTLLQPLWIEDLVTCLVWALEEDRTRNQTYSVGGPEFLPFTQILAMIMERTRTSRKLMHVSPPYLHFLTTILETILPSLPTSTYWVDYLASNRTCSLDTIPRTFNLLPSRFSHRLEYLQNQGWRSSFFQTVFRRRPRD